ncbi:MAG: hypothetical protein WAQ99_15255 [Pyrinomonadaceae bacterium]
MPRAFLLSIVLVFVGCTSVSQPQLISLPESAQSTPAAIKPAKNSVPVIHVFVALCDNVNQGIVPVSASLGNGESPATNLYWGAAFGVKTFFSKNKDWQAVNSTNVSIKSPSVVLNRVVFRHRRTGAFLIAEAYRGSYIQRATEDFLDAAAGVPGEKLIVSVDGKAVEIYVGGSADLIAYIGHNGLMDFQLSSIPKKRDHESREAIILACASKSYFGEPLRRTGAKPLLWTTNLMAPEAYVLSAALDGWLNRETDEQIRLRGAKAYSTYQRIGLRGANALFATGW